MLSSLDSHHFLPLCLWVLMPFCTHKPPFHKKTSKYKPGSTWTTAVYLGHVVIQSIRIPTFTFFRSEGAIKECDGVFPTTVYVADTADLNNRRAGEDLHEPLMWKKETVTSGTIICMQMAERMEHINTDYAWWQHCDWNITYFFPTDPILSHKQTDSSVSLSPSHSWNEYPF